jgi:hypothetical protein
MHSNVRALHEVECVGRRFLNLLSPPQLGYVMEITHAYTERVRVIWPFDFHTKEGLWRISAMCL